MDSRDSGSRPPNPSAPGPRGLLERLFLPSFVGLACFLCFVPSLGNGFVNWDDEVNFLHNPHYRGLSPDNLRWMFTHAVGHYIPITWMTLGLDYAVWGMDPRGYHLTSLLFHTANAVLFYFLALALLRRTRSDVRGLRWAAAAGALFFAIHPLRVESVVWVTERRDVVSGFFFLLSLLAYLRMTAGRSPKSWWIVSIGCFALSLLSKTMGMTLPLVLLVLDAYPLRRWKGARPYLEKIPYLALTLAAAAITIATQENAGAMHGMEKYSLLDRVAQPGYRACFYLGKTALPLALWPLYRLTPGEEVLQPKFAGCLAVAVVATILLWRRRGKWPAGLATWAAYLLLLSPVIGVLQAGPHFAADRYTYLACMPFALLVGGGILRLRTRPWVAALAAVLLAATLGILTVRQARIWKDSMTLWNHVLEHDPSNSTAYYNRALAREALGDLAGAFADYTEAVRNDPRHSMAYLNRGNVRSAWGDLRGARDDYDRATAADPRSAAAYFNRAGARFALGEGREAIEDYSRAIEIDPTHADAYVNRGNVRHRMGDLEGAIADHTEALRLQPRHVLAYFNRALVRQELGDRPGAAADYARALEMAPPDWPIRERARDALRGLER